MRRSVLVLFLLVVSSVFTVAARAGTESVLPAAAWRPATISAGPALTVQALYVSIWPEYEFSVDKPGQLNVLVINRFMLDTQNITYPAKISFQIPATAVQPHVVAVGQTLDTVSDANVEYTTSAAANGWIDVVVTTTGPAIQLEYYDYNIVRAGASREYVYEWPGTYAVGTFHLDLRVPMRATKMRSMPNISTTATDADGFKFGETTVPDMTVGKVFTFKIDYDRNTDQPSTSFMQVKPSVPLDQPVNGQFSLSAYVPWAVAGLALVLLVVLAIWYWLSTHGAESSPRLRKRHASVNRQAEDEPREIYCHECGKRAQASDRFCRTCGAELRQGE